MSDFTPDMRRLPHESIAAWANRLREMRGGADGLEWHETPSGDCRLRTTRNPQSKLDL